jgi:PAS domain S-box-containing protein/diguanylate cyclase (GGDEF)-like protein
MFKKEIEKLKQHKNSSITITNSAGEIVFVNEEFEKISGYSSDEAIGNTFSIIRSKDTPLYLYKQLWSNLAKMEPWSQIMKNVNKNGEYYFINLTVTPIVVHGNVYYMGESTDMTSCVHQIEHMYHYRFNKLTGMHDRSVLVDDIIHRSEDNFQLALLNIDDFKEINDYFGYQNGDILIYNVADIILNHLDINDYKLYHISIDEFALTFTYNSDSLDINTEIKEFKDLVKTIIQNIENTNILLLDDLETHINITAGISNGNDIWKVLREADIALSYAKTQHHHIVDFTKVDQLNKYLSTKMFWLKEINKAVLNDNIVPWLQPIANNRTGKIVKFEALMRLIDTENAVIPPGHFIDISKPTKLYEKISMMMIKKTLKHFSTNHDDFNINMSWEDVKSKPTTQLLIQLLDKYENLGKRMTVEIVESESIENFESFNNFLSKLRQYGVKIALDDFGSGYSNFVYLDKIKANYVKIDGTLIKDMMINDNTLQIVKSIITIAHKFQIETVAEFVSDEKIFKKVKSLGIDYSQGYYIGKPRPVDW